MKRLSVAVVLPIGVFSKDYQLWGGAGGDMVEIKAAWSAELLSLKLLHKALDIFEYPALRRVTDAKGFGLDMKFQEHRGRVHEILMSTGRFKLPFRYYDFLEDRCYLFWASSSTRTVYIRLGAIEDQSYAAQNRTVLLAQ